MYHKTNEYIDIITGIRNGTLTSITSPVADVLKNVIGILEDPTEYASQYQVKQAMDELGEIIDDKDITEIVNRINPERLEYDAYVRKTTHDYFTEKQKASNRFPIAAMLINAYPDIPMEAVLCPTVEIVTSEKEKPDEQHDYSFSFRSEWYKILTTVDNWLNKRMKDADYDATKIKSVRISRLSDVDRLDGILQIIKFDDKGNTENMYLLYKVPQEYIAFGNTLTKDLLKTIARHHVKCERGYNPDQHEPFTWNDFHEIPKHVLRSYAVNPIEGPEKNGIVSGLTRPNSTHFRTLIVSPDEILD